MGLGAGTGEGWGEGSGGARGKTMRVAVPAMPMPLAILCCVLNFLVPGLGTMLAGLSACCCSRNEDMTLPKRCGSCCTSLAIGLLQLITTALLLLGWIWSCFWGIFFLGMSSEYYHDNPPEGGTVITQAGQPVVVQPGTANYPRGYPVQQQQTAVYPVNPGYQNQNPQPPLPPQGGYMPPPHGYAGGPAPQQGYPQQGYPQGQGPPLQGYQGGPPQAQGSYGGYGQPDLPPPYTERDTTPSAPPVEKMGHP